MSDERTAILEATLRLISKNGFHGTAMSKVAKEAGVSTGIIYHYFESKDELIDELYRTIKRRFAETVLKEFDQNQPLRTQIRQIFENTFRYYIRRPQESAFVEQYTISPYYRPELELEMSKYYRPAIECVARGKQEMIIKDFPDAVILSLTLDVATSLAQKQAAGFINLTDELIERIIDALWEAIRQ
ncbi:TetR/AcrR family transcriptional regulator [bacterium]|nr:TetR/AcrR family transcriptional regulator [bacterium]